MRAHRHAGRRSIRQTQIERGEEAIAAVTGALGDRALRSKNTGMLSKRPTPIKEATGGATLPSNWAIVLIPLLLDRSSAGKYVKVSTTVEAGRLESIDREAERLCISRSAFMSAACAEKLVGARVTRDDFDTS
jgi:hypothetical protein